MRPGPSNWMAADRSSVGLVFVFTGRRLGSSPVWGPARSGAMMRPRSPVTPNVWLTHWGRTCRGGHVLVCGGAEKHVFRTCLSQTNSCLLSSSYPARWWVLHVCIGDTILRNISCNPLPLYFITPLDFLTIIIIRLEMVKPSWCCYWRRDCYSQLEMSLPWAPLLPAGETAELQEDIS